MATNLICLNRLANNDNETCKREVKGRIDNCKDFATAEVMNHPICYVSFRHGHNFNIGEGGKSKGRSSDLNMLSCFHSTCEWLEGETEPHTMSEFEAKMKVITNSDVFSKKYLKTLLKQKYSEFIDFTRDNGVSNVIIFKNMAAYIITKKYKEVKEGIIEETACIISTAANLIKTEICWRNYSNKKWLDPAKPSVIVETNYQDTVTSRKYRSVYTRSFL